MRIQLPDAKGVFYNYELTGTPVQALTLTSNSSRVLYSAAHVVSEPFGDHDPTGPANVDWDKTMEFRHYLAGLGMGIAEAMDTAQRGMGLIGMVPWNLSVVPRKNYLML